MSGAFLVAVGAGDTTASCFARNAGQVGDLTPTVSVIADISGQSDKRKRADNLSTL